MNEPTVRIKADRTQRIYFVEGEELIVNPERAQALAGFCSPVGESTPEPAPEPEDRRVRGKKEK
jgi:hypothetical protein